MSPENRLKAAALCAAIIRKKIEMNDGRYSGSFVPNLQSIIDLATIESRYLPPDAMDNIERLAKAVGL